MVLTKEIFTPCIKSDDVVALIVLPVQTCTCRCVRSETRHQLRTMVKARAAEQIRLSTCHRWLLLLSWSDLRSRRCRESTSTKTICRGMPGILAMFEQRQCLLLVSCMSRSVMLRRVPVTARTSAAQHRGLPMSDANWIEDLSGTILYCGNTQLTRKQIRACGAFHRMC